MISRRQTLALGGAAVLAGAGGFAAASDRRAVGAILAHHFPGLADTGQAAQFVDDFLEVWSQNAGFVERRRVGAAWALGRPTGPAAGDAEELEHAIVNLFIRSTTCIRAQETGEEMEYLGLALPPGHTCANPLSAAWL